MWKTLTLRLCAFGAIVASTASASAACYEVAPYCASDTECVPGFCTTIAEPCTDTPGAACREGERCNGATGRCTGSEPAPNQSCCIAQGVDFSTRCIAQWPGLTTQDQCLWPALYMLRDEEAYDIGSGAVCNGCQTGFPCPFCPRAQRCHDGVCVSDRKLRKTCIKGCASNARKCLTLARGAFRACGESKPICRGRLKAQKRVCRDEVKRGKAGCRGQEITSCAASPESSDRLTIVLDRRTSTPLGVFTISVDGTDPTTQYSIEFDLGAGAVIRTPLSLGATSPFYVRAPLGRIDAMAAFAAGDVAIRLIARGSAGESTSDSAVLGIEAMPIWSGNPGVPTRALLAATKQLAVDAAARYAGAATQYSGLDVGDALRALDDQASHQEELATLLEGGGAVGVIGLPATLDSSSVEILDRIALAYIESLPLSLGGQRRSLGLEDFSDFLELPQRVSADFRDFLDAKSDVVGTGLMLISCAALVAGAPEIALGVAVVGAISFMVDTVVGTGITAALDMGSVALTNGRVALDDASTTVEFFGSQYLDAARDYVAGKLGGQLCGALCEDLGAGASSLIGTIERLVDDVRYIDECPYPPGDPCCTPCRGPGCGVC